MNVAQGSYLGAQRLTMFFNQHLPVIVMMNMGFMGVVTRVQITRRRGSL